MGEGSPELPGSLLEGLVWCSKVGPEHVHLYPVCTLFPCAALAGSAVLVGLGSRCSSFPSLLAAEKVEILLKPTWCQC